jgi:hypothetical protein
MVYHKPSMYFDASDHGHIVKRQTRKVMLKGRRMAQCTTRPKSQMRQLPTSSKTISGCLMKQRWDWSAVLVLPW